MKSAAIPSIRVEPALRDDIERSLNEGESVSAFVEASVRESVRRRLDQAEFLKRGIASIAEAHRSGDCVSADSVIRRLEDRLTAARAAKARKAVPAR